SVAAHGEEAFAEQLDALVPELLAERELPGAAVAIIHAGEIVYQQGYGVENTESGEPVTPDSIFHVASISKVFTAWALLGLVEDGELALDDPAMNYVTRWQFPENRYDQNEVTLRRILSHTAGLSVDGYPGYGPDDELVTLEQALSGEGAGG